MTDRVGQHFGNYQLIKVLGQGGFARVYLGKHRYLNRYAALKMLHTTIYPENANKFLAEAQALADLRHPHIVHLLDFAIENGTLVLIMDYALKGSLRQYNPDGTRMPLTTVVEFVNQIAAALQYAHKHHVIHRDVKPENVLLDADNRLLLSDFGLSLLTPSLQQLGTQDLAGTARYMAPEQLLGKPCFASDQYALAVMTYEWLCGAPPFHGNRGEIQQQHLRTDPPLLRTVRPELPLMVEDIVRRALAKKPQDRFASIQDFAQALARASQIYTTLIDEIAIPGRASPPTTLHPSPTTTFHKATPLPPQSNSTVQIPIRRAAAPDPPEHPSFSTLRHENRIRLMQRVRSFWITGVLEQSLHGVALMTLGLQEQRDAVANPWRLIIQTPESRGTPLPAGTRITEAYDKAHGELLILGEPGAGKTTLLLELARDLLERAEHDRVYPIPVVFNLSSWTRKRQPLATWLIEELETKYQVPRKIGSDWINADQILPLLDGLDEVDVTYRTACIQAINDYHHAHNLVPLVVCCRVHEYLSQTHRLTLDHAITIQPLTSRQINEYLTRIGAPVASLRVAFQNDAVLQELATTPLMLTILIMAYQDASLEEITGDVSAEVRRQQIFALYTERMLQRRKALSRYEPQQTIHWLSYLAQQMKQQSQSVFYIERMQPSWLMQKAPRRLYYALTVGPIFGLFVGIQILGTVLPFPLTVLLTALIIGLLFGWLSEPVTEKKGTKSITRLWMRIRQKLTTALENRVQVGIAGGLFIGLCSALYLYLADFSDWPFISRIAGALAGGLPNGMCMGVAFGLTIRLERKIEPMEGARWSWTGIRRDIFRWLLIGIGSLVGLVCALPFVISSHDGWLANFLSYGLSTAFQLVLVATLVSGITLGVSKRMLDEQHIVTPNQGTWRSARYGLTMAIITAGIAAVFTTVIDFTAYFWLPHRIGSAITPLDMDNSAVNIMSHLLGFHPATWPQFWALHALFWGMIDAAIPGLAVGLSCGGAAYMQHFVLRMLLCCARSVPFNYANFLDYAAERILLRKVGGGYIFIHRLLLEYFVDVDQDEKVFHDRD